MTLNLHRRRDRARCRQTRVWLDGEEVTTRCIYVDPRRGVVRLYRLNAEGKKYLDSDPLPPHGGSRVATEERRGHVRTAVRR